MEDKLSHHLSLWLFEEQLSSWREEEAVLVRAARKHQVFSEWGGSRAICQGAGAAEPGSFEGHREREVDCCVIGHSDDPGGWPQI